MSPLYQVLQSEPNPDGTEGDVEVRVVDLPETYRSQEQIAAERLQQKNDVRVSERYASFVEQPIREEIVNISKDTQQRMMENDAEKRAVPNSVTAHSDITKVAAGEEVNLVPTSQAYTEADPTEGEAMSVTDRTVNPAFRSGGATPELDRAEATLAQPRGDEYSADAATGPTILTGPAAATDEVVEKVAEEDGADEAQRQRDAAKEAAEAAEANVKEEGGEGSKEGPNATEAAVQLAKESGVDLATLKGTGADGRITVGDVRTASEKA
jgi:pyruvate/2-oxoglutarate dehydrogenase complex dihydrolipoamide acyltransferase (E2) component